MSDQSPLLQRALSAIDDLSARLEESEGRGREPIAVVGMACRFPGGANTPEKYWSLLRDGGSGIVEIPPDRWDVDAYYDPDLSEPGTMYTRKGGFLGPVDEFDAGLFRISPREAATMDPQQRLLLECAWEALEHASIAPDSLGRTETGVFVGITASDYSRLLRIGREDSDVYSATGCALNAAAGRIAFVLGLQGPCMAVDTACSSSLVAAHLASQSLRNGECDTALVGGVNVMLSPENFALFSKWGMISRSGECRAFDDDAEGFVRGEGCGMLVLKRMSDAERDGDRILALIRGSAVNQDGPSSGLSVPNGPAQEKVIRAALHRAGVGPEAVGFVEAHGTGTPLGDPIEVEALGEVYGEGHTHENPLLLGSVKPSIGHLESAAGTAGLIKLIMALRHGEIPPQSSFSRPNTRIDWDHLPVRVVDSLRSWPGQGPRIGAVSSFGFSGTNVHMVLEAPRPSGASEAGTRQRIVPLSAQSDTALQQAAAALAQTLSAQTVSTDPAQTPSADASPALADVERTLATGRATLPRRAAVIGDTAEVLAERLRALSEGTPSPGLVQGAFEGASAPRIVFLYSGQGSQYHRMGMELREAYPVFRESFDRCIELVREAGGPDLMALLSGDDEAAIHRTEATQPALFALEYALTELFAAWGIRPAAVLGHSIGEVVAACVAGVLELPDAARLVVERGRLMQELPAGGGMLAVETSAEVALEVSEPYRERVSLAGRNGPTSVVLSGGLEELGSIAATLEEKGIRTRALTVSHAFHSPLMEPMQAAFERMLGGMELRAPRIPLVSNLDGTLDPRAGASVGYWSRHVREPVAFEPSMRTLADQGYQVFLEIGPRPVLSGMANRFLELPEATWATTLRARPDESGDVLEGLGRLFTAGARPDWRAVLAGDGHPTTLPTYPFQRERHWAAAAPSPRAAVGHAAARSEASSHPLLGGPIRSPLATLQFPCDLDPASQPLLDEHRVAGLTVFPASGYIELARASMAGLRSTSQQGSDESVRIENGRFRAALILGGAGDANRTDAAPEVMLALTPDRDGGGEFQLFSRPAHAAADGSWTLHAEGGLRPADAPPESEQWDKIEARCTETVDIDAYQARIASVGLDYGPQFRALVAARHTEGEAAGVVRLPTDDTGGLGVHPGLLDAAFHLIGLAHAQGDQDGDEEDRFLLPTGFEAVSVFASPGSEVRVHCRIRDSAGSRVVADLVLLRPDGTVAVTVDGLETRPVSREQFRAAIGAGSTGPLLTMVWEPLELVAQGAGPGSASGAAPGGASDPDATTAPWGVLAADDALGALVVERLGEAGVAAVLIAEADAAKLAGSLDRFGGLLDLRAVGAAPSSAAPGAALSHQTAPSQQAAEGPVGRTLDLLATLARKGAELPVTLVTRMAQQVVPSELVDPLSAVLWGIGATADVELPGLTLRMIDIGDPATDVTALAALVATAGAEGRMAVRDGSPLAARVVRPGQAGATGAVPATTHPAPSQPVPPAPYTLDIRERGSLNGLELRPTERRDLAPHEVEIEVMASGMNFRDVLNLLDMYPGEVGPPGNECSGRVVATGSEVESVSPGDLVTCIADSTFGSHVVAGASMVFPVPAELSVAQAAVFPIAQLTAWLGLHRLGGIQEGDRVLIHAGAGGVGLAAVHLALAAGAEVIATAGSDEKRDVLRGLGVAHVFDSRSTLAAERVLEATGGHGVDIVLNSLTGEAIDEGIRSLAPGGRFIEIGLRDLRTPEEVSALRDDVTYTTMILGEWCVDQPEAVREMWQALTDLLTAGAIPGPRVRRYPLHRVSEAFSFMARARHIGRLAVMHPSRSAPRLRADGAYLVTGGLGALGLHVADWLADGGAGTILLMGRSAPSQAAEARIHALRERGVDVRVVAGDVTRADDLGFLSVGGTPPLRGVIHTAGIADDALLARHDGDRLRRVMAPKTDGAVELLRAMDAAGADLDLLIFFSSGSALLGSPGQAAYTGANAFLDAWAQRLAAEGRSAVSIGWGAWKGDGMAAGVDERTARQWEARGVGAFSVDDALAAMDEALATGHPRIAALPMEWSKFFAGMDQVPPLLSRLHAPSATARSSQTDSAAQRHDALIQELAPLPRAQRTLRLRERLRTEVAAVLGMSDPAELEPKRGFAEQGMDSLMSVELAGRIGALSGVDLPSTFLFDQPTLDALTGFLLEALVDEGLLDPATGDASAHGAKGAAGSATGAPDAGESDPEGEALEEMSEDELEAELLRELDAADLGGAP